MREKGRAAIYLLAAVYLFGLAYKMFGARMEHGGEDYALMMAFSVIFAIFGIALSVFSVVLFKKYAAEGKKGSQDNSPEGQDSALK